MKSFFVLLSAFVFLCGDAQDLPAFKPLRYDEDYSFLKTDSNRTGYRRLKYTPLGVNRRSFVSLGGEVRYQYFAIHNEDWGDSPNDKDGYVLSRFLLHSDLHLGRRSRFFVQVQGSLADGKKSGTSPVHENPLDLHQAFWELRGKRSSVAFRLGRQELSYGSQRLVSVRELPNNRQSFDAAKLILPIKSTKVDLFYSHYVTAKKGIFDDRSTKAWRFWGAYLVSNNVPFFKHIDVYYLGLHKDDAVFEDGTGTEHRHTFGTRIWGAGQKWKYDLESVYQFGTFGKKSITAWTASSSLSYKMGGVKFHPELSVRSELISGDVRNGDNKLQTFNPLFPRGAYFGLAALIGPANLVDVHPSVSLELVPGKLVWTSDYDIFWRHRTSDGIYAPNVSLLYPSGGSGKKLIGQQFATDLTCNANNYLMMRVEGTLFRTGPYLKEVGSGKNLIFLGVTAQLKF
jgi:hypothetical protein